MNKIIFFIVLFSLLQPLARAKKSKRRKDGDNANQFLRHPIRDLVQYEEKNAALGLNTNDTIQTRIVSGVSVANDEFPAFVDLELGCGGSLISPNTVLTAAHCLSAPWSPYVSINAIQRGIGIQREIVAVGIHPLWDDIINYDFAIMRLKDDVMGPTVALNRDDNKPSDGDDLIVIGLGKTSLYGEVADTLQKATVPYVETRACSNIYQGIFDSTSMLCAGEKSKDSCQGDSGGPLMDKETGDQVGVVSFGVGCGATGYPGVYSRVTSAINWIDDQICLHASAAETASASFSSDCESRQPVKFEITYNSNSDETIWSLKNIDDDMLFTGAPPSGTDQAETTEFTKSTEFNLQSGVYTFEIKDAGKSKSEYKILGINGAAIKRSDSFTTSDIVKFAVRTDGSITDIDFLEPAKTEKPQEISSSRSKKEKNIKGEKGEKGNKRKKKRAFRKNGS